MPDQDNFFLCAVLLGVGATAVMDLWAFGLKRLFGLAGLDYALVGRWFCHMRRGRFTHRTIFQATPAPGERPVGWGAHYGVGVLFAAIFLVTVGADWIARPQLSPALIFGLATVCAPFFVMQPSFGFGIAAAKTPDPMRARLMSLGAHMAFGLGLYVSGLVLI